MPADLYNLDDEEILEVINSLQDRGGAKLVGVNNLDRSKYHPPSAAGHKRAGVVLPAGESGGTSSAFDSLKKGKVVVNPSHDGFGGTSGGFSVDLAKLTAEEQNFANAQVKDKFAGDPKARMIAAYKIMASMIVKKEKAGLEKSALERSAAATFNAPVTKPLPAQFTGSILDMVRSTNNNHQAGEVSNMDTVKVDFEFPKPVGRLTAFYHDVFWDEEAGWLCLVYNTQSGAPKWFPGFDRDQTEQAEIGVLVYDKQGRPNTAFSAQPLPIMIPFHGHELGIMAINAVRSCNQTPEEVAREQNRNN